MKTQGKKNYRKSEFIMSNKHWWIQEVGRVTPSTRNIKLHPTGRFEILRLLLIKKHKTLSKQMPYVRRVQYGLSRNSFLTSL